MMLLAFLIAIGTTWPSVALADWAKPQHRDDVIERMRNWDKVPPSEWPRTTAPALMDLLNPMLGGFPSRMEGRPSVAISVRRLEDDPLMLAHVRMQGFLDDSVNGEEFMALAETTYGGWRLIALWRRHECARGWNEGRWVTTPCS